MRFRYATLLTLAACTASGDEVAPKSDELFFPTGLAVAPDDSVLFVANANSELRFDSGLMQVIDLAIVDSVSTAWIDNQVVPDGCTPDTDRTETLICEEAMFIRVGAGARIGNFATDIAVQDLGAGALRLIVPTRGDPSVAWIDYRDQRLSCSTSTDDDALCDDAHRLSYTLNDTNLSALPEEPFAAYADSVGQFAMITHLTTGAVTLIDSPRNADAQITDVVGNVFAPDPSTGLRGATGIAGRATGAEGSIVYVGSRSEDRVQTFTVGRPVNEASPFLLAGGWFFLDGVGGTSGGSQDSRGMAFSPSGERLYLVNRRPPSIQVIDTTLDEGGFPRNKLVGAADICRQASTIAVMDAGSGERAYVTCFQDGELYVIDPRGLSMVEDVITVGRGPQAVAAAPSRKKLYVTNFLEDTIAVIDVRPGVPTHDRVVLRIGVPRVP